MLRRFLCPCACERLGCSRAAHAGSMLRRGDGGGPRRSIASLHTVSRSAHAGFTPPPSRPTAAPPCTLPAWSSSTRGPSGRRSGGRGSRVPCLAGKRRLSGRHSDSRHNRASEGWARGTLGLGGCRASASVLSISRSSWTRPSMATRVVPPRPCLPRPPFWPARRPARRTERARHVMAGWQLSRGIRLSERAAYRLSWELPV